VFGDHDSGAYLRKFAWTKIVRHEMVTGTASPDDPTLADYWAERQHKGSLSLVDVRTRRALREQQGRCPLCRDFLLHAEHEPRSPRGWEQWLTTVRKAIKHHAIAEPATIGGPPDDIRIRLVHAQCLKLHEQAMGNRSPLLHIGAPEGLA
jgi:RNA-directed DNA polymerase